MINRKVIYDLNSIKKVSQNILTEVSDKDLAFKKQEAIEIYKNSLSLLQKYKNVYSHFEKTNFLNNKKLESICNDTLSNFYSTEFKLKDNYFKFVEEDKFPEDAYLINQAAHLSLNSL